MFEALEKFVKCIDNKSISITAKQIGVTQPALSLALQKLEKDLGAKLFFRSKQGITTTKIGQVVYEEAKKSANQLHNIQAKVNELNDRFEKTLKIGMIDNFGLTFLRSVWQKINLQFPQLRLDIDINNSDFLIKQAVDQQIDLGIITQQLNKNIKGDLIQKFLTTEELILVCSNKLRDKIHNLNDLKNYDFYSYNEKSTTNKLIQQFFNEHNVITNITVYSTSPSFIIELLKFGHGIAFLPTSFVENDLKNLELIRVIPKVILERKLALIYHRDVYLNARKKGIINLLQEAIN